MTHPALWGVYINPIKWNLGQPADPSHPIKSQFTRLFVSMLQVHRSQVWVEANSPLQILITESQVSK